jgi:hypothetical protein
MSNLQLRRGNIMNIEILSCGTETVEVIKIIREATGWDLKEAENFVSSVDSGSRTLNNVTPGIAERLKKIGVIIRDTYVDGNIFTPIVASNQINGLDREDTMRVLLEVEKIAEESERYEQELAELEKQTKEGTQKAAELRKKVSTLGEIIIWSVVLIMAFVGLVYGYIPGAIGAGVAALIVMNLTVKKVDLKIHAAKNNKNADNYLAEHVAPAQARLNEVLGLRDELINSGKKGWAVDVVGNELFYSACVEDLYNLIKNRRADNLKEALNKYDDALYKERMEEMQASIQNASEISAKEAVKQTAYSKDIAKNTHQAATAAKATAYHTRKIDRNLRTSK